jgi:hypothetical protein
MIRTVLLFGCLFESKSPGKSLNVKPMVYYRTTPNSGLFAPNYRDLTGDEKAWLKHANVELHKTETGYDGRWSGRDGESATIVLSVLPARKPTVPHNCETWLAFKDWAQEIRRTQDGEWLRGHGTRLKVRR